MLLKEIKRGETRIIGWRNWGRPAQLEFKGLKGRREKKGPTRKKAPGREGLAEVLRNRRPE